MVNFFILKFSKVKCKTREKIPTNIVEMLDKADQFGDTSVPPSFDCTKCDGKWYQFIK